MGKKNEKKISKYKKKFTLNFRYFTSPFRGKRDKNKINFIEESQEEEKFEKALINDDKVFKELKLENEKTNIPIKRMSQSQSQNKIRQIIGDDLIEKSKETIEREELLNQFSSEKRRFTNIKKLLEFDFFHLKADNKPKKEKRKIFTRSLEDGKREKVK
jgi:beta-galactosidase GanA